ncbi:coactivator-associated arginine methyltransferase 1, putative [Plasmodium ovale]|uniref:Histone-arginine methyltransferase CARM1, putative n=2 Tax=Plasmodium ovale TaxID=36330 RepID=A0A1A8WYY5_PLAOA|nr:histone-arginine methyltransferase CARM1, putative [Plasmodium ovale curtisi]SBS98184.1 histone-arginine methyltransferase CARM1, putative [Plasmodium ovale curtisi]SCQ16919.1 coactivator-associated arginine methyltransferase 1, putative [Plasmodium ovale]
MEDVNEHVTELLGKIEELVNNSNDESKSKEKEKYVDDVYAYSLCDNYKSRKTKNVIIHMLCKNINIMYYKEEYKNIIFINFLRLCQLNNLNVKLYHDMFLKYNIYTAIVNYNKYVNFFLKPIINNDKLLWDVNSNYFDMYNLEFDLLYHMNDVIDYRTNDINAITELVFEEDLKLKLKDLVENSSNCTSSLYSEDDFSFSSDEEKFECVNSLNDSHHGDVIREHGDEKKADVITPVQLIDSNLNYDMKDVENSKNANILSDTCGTVCNVPSVIDHGKCVAPNGINIGGNKKIIDKFKRDTFSSMNNINMNNLIDLIVYHQGKDENSSDANVRHSEDMDQVIIDKFVKMSENEQQQVCNLEKKVSSMEKVIKHLMGEIAKRDMGKRQKGRELLQKGNVNTRDDSKCGKKIPASGLSAMGRNVIPFTCDKVEQSDMQNEEKENLSEVDKKYFDSYNYTSIHRTMILDKCRTNCYYEFVNKNKELFRDKIILDIGCGSSIISLFCADYAKIVVGIDSAEKIVNKAKKIVEKNGINNIYIFKGKLENNNLYIDDKGIIYYLNKKEDIEKYKKINNISQLNILKFDIIISEWMGYFLFYECMINTILYARDFYLKDNGYIFPNKVNLYIAGYNDSKYIDENIFIWDKPMYNKDLSELKPDCKKFMENAKVMSLHKDKISTDIVNYATIDMYTYNKKDGVYVCSDFEILVGEKRVTSLCFYFDCLFEAHAKLEPYAESHCETSQQNTCSSRKSTILTTSILSEETHWKQVLLHLHNSNYNIANIFSNGGEGDNYLRGTIYISPTGKHSRNVNVLLQIKKNKHINIGEDWTCYYSVD